ncbi:Ferric-chelate reductase 1 [Manis javanica]|nr:Ferric-chelate reductase 1 [Manis javanica]
MLTVGVENGRTAPQQWRGRGQVCAVRAAHTNAGVLQEYELLLRAIREEAGCPAPSPSCEQDSAVSWRKKWPPRLVGCGAQPQGLVGKREQGWSLAELADLQAVAFPWSSPLPPHPPVSQFLQTFGCSVLGYKQWSRRRCKQAGQWSQSDGSPGFC